MIRAQLQQLNKPDNAVEAEWRDLEMRGQSTIFTSWDWAGTLLAILPATCALSLLRLSDRGETVGLAYLGSERAVRHLLVWSRRLHLNSAGEKEYNCLTTEDNLLIAKPELSNACWDGILRWFAHEQDLADELVLPGLREPLDFRTNYGLRCVRSDVYSYHVDLSQLKNTGGRFADLLSKNARYQLRRSIRDYGGPGAIELMEARSTDEALAWFDNMKTLHIDSWKRRGKPHSFLSPFFEVFHRSFIRRTFAAGRIQMLRIDASGSPIGYLYNFRDGARTYAYQSGFADQNHRLRPGAVSHALAIEYNFRLGVGVYDFLAGANRLKSSFATGYRHQYWTTIQLPRVRFRLENLASYALHRGLFGH